MTETLSPPPAAEDIDGPPGEPWTTQEWVARQARRLQKQYLPPDQTPWSRAALAELRRSLGRPLGSSPTVLALVVNPSTTYRGDDETHDERAIATALGLYATHQQSQSAPMHVPATSFGTAVGRIQFKGGDEVKGVTRRFHAFGTAQSWEELVHHARGLVQLLRDERQGFDYGRFAHDLAQFPHPHLQDAVRLRWGRDFYRVTAAPADASTSTAATATPTAEEQ